jgi:hypothetical protein
MKGVEVEPEQGIQVAATTLDGNSGAAASLLMKA